MREFTDDDFLRDTDVYISDGRIVIKCSRGRWVEAGFCLETVDKRARETYFRYLNNGAYDSPIDPEKDEKMRRAMDLTDIGLGDSHRIPVESAGNGSPDSHIRDIKLPHGYGTCWVLPSCRDLHGVCMPRCVGGSKNRCIFIAIKENNSLQRPKFIATLEFHCNARNSLQRFRKVSEHHQTSQQDEHRRE